MNINTQLIHAGNHEQRTRGAVTLPIFQTSIYTPSGDEDHLRYIRYGNTPNHLLLHQKFAAIEGTEAAVVAGSGIAAISTVFLSALKPGDHVLAAEGLYGGSHKLLTKDLAAMGITHSFLDMSHPKRWESQLRPNTRLFHVESISNPLMKVPDLEAVVEFGRRHGLLLSIDSTFTPAVLFRPACMGFDYIIHSCSKFYNGHSDILAGMIAGKKNLVEAVRLKIGDLGAGLDPHSCFLLNRGLLTLALRVERQCSNALQLAEFLSRHRSIDQVYYPGLSSSVGHRFAAKHYQSFGSMLAFTLKNSDPRLADQLIHNLRLAVLAPSLGGVESLAIRPVMASHMGLTLEERKHFGIEDHLVRFSVGIEAIEDLIGDFDQALRSLN